MKKSIGQNSTRLFWLMALVISTIGSAVAADPTIEQLKVQLKSPDPKVRVKAVQELANTASREAVPPLLTVVKDLDDRVRLEAVRALGEFRDQSATTMLLDALKDSEEKVREAAIVALVSYYVEKDAEFVVTRVAKKVYGTVNPFSDKVGNDSTVVEPWVKVNPSIIEGIANMLRDPSSPVRLDAARSLGVLRAEAAIPRMVEGMQTGDANLKIALLRSFYKIKQVNVEGSLLPYLNDADKNVRFETILTLGLLRSKQARPTLEGFYNQRKDEKLRKRALEALAMIGDPASMDIFRRNLKDPDSEYRQYAAEGLGRIANPSVTEDVSRAYLEEKKLNAQLAMSFALFQLGRREYLDKLVAGLGEMMHYQQAEVYLIEMGKPVAQDLTKFLDSPDERIRARTCYVLGVIGESSVAERIRPLMNDSDSSVVMEASTALRRLNSR